MAKINFDIKYRPQIESGEYKVETRDGRPARIICWDRKSGGGSNIIALVNDGAIELNYFYKNNGKFLSSDKDHIADLFIIIPELSESEDKRIKQFFAELATDACGGPGQEHYEELGLNYDKVMGWLEDQKEKNTLSTEETELNSIAFMEQLGYTCVPPVAEQKLLMSDGEIEDRKRDIVAAIRKYYSADYAEYLASFLKGLSPEDNSADEYGQEMLGIAYRLMYEHIPENLRTQEFWDSLKFMREYTGKVAIIHSYEKPTECIEFDNEFKNQVSHLLASVLNKEWEYSKGFVEYAAQQLLGYANHEFKSAEWSEDIIRKAVKEVGLTQHQIDWFKTNVFSPKQEWSEEDEDYLTSMKCAVYDYFDEGYAEDLYNWLKFLPERFNLSPKQEWSDEDEDTIEKAICILETNFKPNEGFTGLDINRNQLVERLKSLRPSLIGSPAKRR